MRFGLRGLIKLHLNVLAVPFDGVCRRDAQSVPEVIPERADAGQERSI